MEESIYKAHIAMMDGDREKVLDLIKQESPSPEVLWLRAQSVIDPLLRLTLLNEVVNSDDPVYTPLARQILSRENEYKNQLDQPPDYQFWKKPGMKGKLSSFRRQKAWSLGLLAITLISGLILFSLYLQNKGSLSIPSTTVSQQTPRPTPSITPLPVNNRPRISYLQGDFSIIRVENPTYRKVLFDNYSEGDESAVPALGAVFIAVQYEFLCRIAICEKPPEVPISLKLADGKVVTYMSSSQPVLADYPGTNRIAMNQVVSGWLVFEIPNRADPVALLFPDETSYDAPPLELPMPH